MVGELSLAQLFTAGSMNGENKSEAPLMGLRIPFTPQA